MRKSPTGVMLRKLMSQNYLCFNLDLFVARRFSVMGHVTSDHTMQQELTSDGDTTWNPLDAFQDGARCEYAVIVLNRPIRWQHNVLLRFWQKGCILTENMHILRFCLC